jgi:hypothetical protein
MDWMTEVIDGYVNGSAEYRWNMRANFRKDKSREFSVPRFAGKKPMRRMLEGTYEFRGDGTYYCGELVTSGDDGSDSKSVEVEMIGDSHD